MLPLQGRICTQDKAEHNTPKLCQCCHEEPQVPPPPFPGQKDAPGYQPALQQLCPSHPAPGAVSILPCIPGCAAMPWPGAAPPASSTIPAPHWGFLPDHPGGTAPSPPQQQGP